MESKNQNDMQIKKHLELALYRTGLKCKSETINEIIIDIKEIFPYKKEKSICDIIDKGGCGMYGISYKFTIQLVLYWINRQIKEDSKIDML